MAALWHRIGPTRLGCLSHRCRRCYSLLTGAAVVGRADRRRGSGGLEIPRRSLIARLGPSFGRTPVRSFAAPVQAKPKPKPSGDSASGTRINGAITAAYVRLVTDEGHAIVSRREALDRAMKLNLDLVEVQKTANPPVCKIMDFHREKFKQEEKEKERAKSKSALTLRSGENKEVRFKAKTELKDLKIKAETVVRLMERGYRVKCTAMPNGKEEEDLGGLLARLLALIEDVSVVESGPHVDIKQAYVIVRHLKFATKRSGKKISNVVDAVSRLVRTAVPNATAAASSNIDQDEEERESEDEVSSLKEASNGNFNEVRGWSGFDTADNFEEIFEFDAKGDAVRSDGSGSSHPRPEEDRNNSKPSRQKLRAASVGGGIPASKPGPGSLKAKLEIKRETTKIDVGAGFVSSQSELSIVGRNRYSKPSEGKGRFQQTKSSERNTTVPETRGVPNQVRMTQQPTGNEGDRRGQFDPKQRQIHPSNPSSPSSSYRDFNSPKTSGSGDQSKSSDRSLPSQSYGNFSASKATVVGDQKNPGDATMGNPSDRSLPSRSYGIFSGMKTNESGDQENSRDANTGKPSNPRDATVGKPRDPGSSAPSYGIFSTAKPAVSGDQRNLQGTTSGKVQ